jgi:hypothetical protein
VEIESEPINLKGFVIRRTESSPEQPETPNLYELSIGFDIPEKTGDTLRRLLFAEQIRIRQRLRTEE